MPFVPVDSVLVAYCADALWQKYDKLGTQGYFGKFYRAELREVAETVIRRAAERGRITDRSGA